MLGSSILRVIDRNQHEVFSPGRKELELSNQNETSDYVTRIKPNLIIHCAATVGGISSNIAHPVKYVLNNTIVDSNLVAASVANEVESFLYMSSSCVYPASNKQPLQVEDLLTGPLEPTNKSYAVAKIAGMQLMDAVSAEYGLAYRSLLLSNLYGPGDNFDLGSSHLIAAAIKKIVEAKKQKLSEIIIMGSGKARREFTYVEDVSQWITSNLENVDKFPTQLNLGYGTDFTVDEYFYFAADALGYTGNFLHDLNGPEGMAQKLMDSSIARMEFNWSPTVDPRQGILKTIQGWDL